MSRSTGTPTWVDVSITQDTTRDFYRNLFGWEFQSLGDYQLITKDGALVGGLMDVTDIPELRKLPRTWDIYLAVDNVDARVAKAVEHGATVVIGPETMGEAGRLVMITDPSGALLGLWESGEITGYEFTMAPGTPVWFEIMSQQYEGAQEFYSKVFDFDLATMPGGEAGFQYSTNGEGDQAVCGICDASPWLPNNVTSYWRVYFAVQDVDQAIRDIEASNGSVLDGPAESPFGRFATVADPEGAMFQINQSPNPEARA